MAIDTRADLLDRIAAPAFIVDRAGVVRAVNRIAEERLGWTDACGRPLADRLAPDDRKRVSDALAAGRIAHAVRLTDRAWHLTATPLQEGDAILVVASEPEPSADDGILQSILNSMSDGVFVADADGRFVLTNQAAQRLTGVALASTSPDEWSSRYGLFHADGVTPVPPDQLPLARPRHPRRIVRRRRTRPAQSRHSARRPQRDRAPAARRSRRRDRRAHRRARRHRTPPRRGTAPPAKIDPRMPE